MGWGQKLRAWRTRDARARLEGEVADALAAGDGARATDVARQSLALVTSVGADHPDVAVARYALAAALLAAGDAAEAEAEAERALDVLPREGRTPFAAHAPPRERVLELLASAAEKQGDAASIERRLRALVEDAERAPHGEARDLRLATASTRLGLALARARRAEDAWPHLARAVTLRRARLGPDDLRVAEALHNAATHRIAGAPLDEAAARFEDAIRVAHTAGAPGRELEEAALHNLGVLREEQGRDEDARAAWESALERRQDRLGKDHPSLRATLVRLARVRERTGSILHAAVLYERALGLARAELGDDHEVVRALAGWRRELLGGDGQPGPS